MFLNAAATNSASAASTASTNIMFSKNRHDDVDGDDGRRFSFDVRSFHKRHTSQRVPLVVYKDYNVSIVDIYSRLL